MYTKHAHRKVREMSHGDGGDEIMELGHEAVKGVATAATVVATTSVLGLTLGSFPKP